MSPTTLYTSWQHPGTRRWFVIGKLTGDEPRAGEDRSARYTFVYTQGVEQAIEQGFSPLAAFPDLDRRYEADALFSEFQNRLTSASRVDYPNMLNWLGLPAQEATPLLVLGRTNGTRQTDALELFRRPEREADGHLCAQFFLRGLRHRHAVIQEAGDSLAPGTKLQISHECQNEWDPYAVMVHNQEGIFGFGHLPRYLAPVALSLLRRDPASARVIVEQVNLAPAPAQLRLLCRFEADGVPENLPLFSDPSFEPLS